MRRGGGMQIANAKETFYHIDYQIDHLRICRTKSSTEKEILNLTFYIPSRGKVLLTSPAFVEVSANIEKHFYKLQQDLAGMHLIEDDFKIGFSENTFSNMLKIVLLFSFDLWKNFYHLNVDEFECTTVANFGNQRKAALNSIRWDKHIKQALLHQRDKTKISFKN